MNPAAPSVEVLNLLASLAAGLVIGIERGWSQRERDDGARVAGLRTFSLVGLMGGVLALVADGANAWVLPGALFALALLLAVASRETARRRGDLSITTAVALLLTLLLGAAAMRGHVAIALGCAVLAAVLLDLKSTLHRWLRLLERRELAAALQLLVLSVVILPNLPDAGYGPYGAINPYRLWWAVVLIAGLSMAGHFAMRLAGAARGLFLAGLLGGLASSTAATLSLARLAARQPALSGLAGAGALAACGVMCFRLLILLGTIEPALLGTFAAPLVVTGLALLLLGARTSRRAPPHQAGDGESALIAPFDLSTALVFGAFLGVMAVAVPAAREWLGTGGVLTLAALSGLLDVDAITISIAAIHRAGGMPAQVAAAALGLAICANMLAKAGIALVAGGRAIGWTVMRGYGIALLPGAVAAGAVLL